jgi:hypothetical protein
MNDSLNEKEAALVMSELKKYNIPMSITKTGKDTYIVKAILEDKPKKEEKK